MILAELRRAVGANVVDRSIKRAGYNNGITGVILHAVEAVHRASASVKSSRQDRNYLRLIGQAVRVHDTGGEAELDLAERRKRLFANVLIYDGCKFTGRSSFVARVDGIDWQRPDVSRADFRGARA